ncbi:MAG TPA: sulfite exporter TauE/SafE family protein [Thermodesulfovibrionales bacterium]|nr:sulfite exporter TauE/SafE family protein [Thermodesulfovibrionales bacterium]
MFYLFLVLAGAIVGFFSGLLGIGGGILMFPLLHYLPQVFGFEAIGVKNITGLTMVQGFFASLSAMLFYQKQGLVNKSLVWTLGLSLFLSSLVGSFASKAVPDKALLFIFGALALIAAALMFIPRSYGKDDLTEDRVSFHKPTAIVIGVTVGFLVGLVGQGGAFITIPLMLYVLKIPLRVALGSTLAIGLFSATAGTIGKVATGQVPFGMAGALLVGAVPVAKAGAWVSKRTKTYYLRWLLALIIAATALKIWTDLFR